MARFGIRAALVATLLQLVDGFWLLLALPEGILKSYMRGGAFTMVPLTTGILAGVLLLMLLAQITDPLAHAVKVRRVLELIVAAVLVMVISRHQLRGFYLAAARADEQVAVAPQWGVFALFLALFVAGMAVTIYAMVKAATDRPATGEPAA
jgi:cellobiose-specific phosphotransferase system component IIC